MLQIPTQWKKIANNIRIHREKVIMVILTMTLALFSVSTIFNTYTILTNALKTSKAASHPADLIFYTSPFQRSAITHLDKTNGIKNIDERFVTSARAKTVNSQYKNMTLIALPDINKMKLNRLKNVNGQLTTGDIFLEQSSTHAQPIGATNKISIQLPNGSENKLTYKGSVYDFNQIPTQFSGEEYGYITIKSLKQFGLTPHLNQLLIQLNKKVNKDNQDKIISQLKGKLSQKGIKVYRFSQPKDVLNQRGKILHTVLTLLVILGSLSLIFGSLLIITAITGIMSYERADIGIMKSLGASSLQIMKMYGDMTVTFGIISFILTIPLSYVVSYYFSHFLASQLNIGITHFHLSKTVIFFDFVISLLTPVLSSIKPIYNVSKMTVIEAMDPFLRRSKSSGKKFLHKSRLLYRPLVLSIRNTFQKKGQLLLTLFTLTLGGAIILSVFCLQSSMKLTLKEITNYWNYDVKINFHNSQPVQKSLNIADKIKGVKSAEGWVARNTEYTNGKSTTKNALLIALPSKTTMILPNPLKGGWLHDKNKQGVVVNEDVLEQTKGLAVGDSLMLEVGNHKETRNIIGVVRSQLMGPIIYMDKNDYAKMTGKLHQINQVVIKTKESTASYQMRMIERLVNKFKKRHVNIAGSDTNRDMRKRPRQMIHIIDSSLLIMGIIIIIVDILNLSTTMSIKVLDRKKDIGIMRAIGASNHTIRFIFITEAIILSLISWAISVMLAIPISLELVKIVGIALLGYPLTYSYSINGLVLWFLISLVIPIIACYFPTRQATKLPVNDIIRYE